MSKTNESKTGFFITNVNWDKVNGRKKYGSGKPGDEWYEEIKLEVTLRGSGNTEGMPIAMVVQEFMDSHMFIEDKDKKGVG